jgi:hypothetical protein
MRNLVNSGGFRWLTGYRVMVSEKEMTRGLGGPRVKRDWRVREAEGGFCAPVDKKTQERVVGSVAAFEKSGPTG